MLLAGDDSIREVIAFPKTRGGFDPLTGAPTPITAAAARSRPASTPSPSPPPAHPARPAPPPR